MTMRLYLHDIDGTTIAVFKTLENVLKKYNSEDRRETVSILSFEEGISKKTVICSWKYENHSLQNFSRLEKLREMDRNQSITKLYGLFLHQGRFNEGEDGFFTQHLFFTHENNRLKYSLTYNKDDPCWFTINVDGKEMSLIDN